MIFVRAKFICSYYCHKNFSFLYRFKCAQVLTCLMSRFICMPKGHFISQDSLWTAIGNRCALLGFTVHQWNRTIAAGQLLVSQLVSCFSRLPDSCLVLLYHQTSYTVCTHICMYASYKCLYAPIYVSKHPKIFLCTHICLCTSTNVSMHPQMSVCTQRCQYAPKMYPYMSV